MSTNLKKRKKLTSYNNVINISTNKNSKKG